MSSIALIFAWIGAGLALRRAGAGDRAFSALDRFIVWVPLPATILLALHRLVWDPSDWAPVSMAWLVFAAAAVLFSAVGRARGWPPRTIGALLLTCGLGNTSFVGFPLLRALYGERALAIAVLCDQPGSFLALATAGVAAASYYATGRPSARAVAGRVARFPPVWALAAAAATRPFAFPEALLRALGLGVPLLIPLALISVGGRLRLTRSLFAVERGPAVLGLLYKLVLAPALTAAVLVLGANLRGEAIRITILEAGMAPMITGAIVAAEHGLDPALCSLMVGAGVPLSLVLVPLWAKLLALAGV